ncbi:MAG: SufD family Fe-S cluster assembly protein [Candidatus Aenigmarchaeota archaeon]|nr:SufD family Fe-S cluster assembly protein [Candidatus Aenigmarchaeota archaeon]
MDMKNAENANYTQTDHEVNITEIKGMEILPSNMAIKKYEWTREYFKGKPKEGYFIWIKEQIDFPVTTCMSIASKSVSQNLQNLIVIEKDLKIKLRGTCNSLKKDLCSRHTASGKIILKKNAVLEYNHIHTWGNEDVVNTDYEFILEKGSKLDYNYKVSSTPGNMKLNTKITCLENSTANLTIIGNCENSDVKIRDDIILKGKNSSGILKLRLVGKENTKILSHSRITTEAECKGHLDCQGLPIHKTSEMILIPELICKDNQSQITHEASIGKISEEELNYLKSRGLNEAEAIELIVNGFLEN